MGDDINTSSRFSDSTTGVCVSDEDILLYAEEVRLERILQERGDKKEIEKTKDAESTLDYKKNKRRFYKMLITDYSKLELNFKIEGLLHRLSVDLRKDGSGEVNIKNVTSINSMANHFGVKFTTISGMLNKLKEQNVLNWTKHKHISKFYINPNFIRYGDRITEELADMFDIDRDLLVRTTR